MAPAFATFPRPLKAAIVAVPAGGLVLAVATALLGGGGFTHAEPWRWLLS